MYRISSIRRRGYYFFHFPFLCGYNLRAATIWGRILFESGVYLSGKPTSINDSWIRFVRAIQQLLDAFSSMRSLPVLLSAVEMSRTSQTALELVRWLSSEITCAYAAYTSRGYYSGAVFIFLRTSACAATIWRRRLFEELRLMWISLHNHNLRPR